MKGLSSENLCNLKVAQPSLGKTASIPPSLLRTEKADGIFSCSLLFLRYSHECMILCSCNMYECMFLIQTLLTCAFACFHVCLSYVFLMYASDVFFACLFLIFVLCMFVSHIFVPRICFTYYMFLIHTSHVSLSCMFLVFVSFVFFSCMYLIFVAHFCFSHLLRFVAHLCFSYICICSSCVFFDMFLMHNYQLYFSCKILSLMYALHVCCVCRFLMYVSHVLCFCSHMCLSCMLHICFFYF